MKHVYQENLKAFLQEEIIKAAEKQNLTKEQVAELLGIDPRSYAYLKAGAYMCSASTLILYLVKMCPDPMAFLAAAKKAVADAEEAVP